MASYMFKPGHAMADESGFVSIEDYYGYNAATQEDKRAMIGNQIITFRFNSDTMAPTQHMADGKLYDSKKAFRDATKRAGCIEVGNETNYIERHNFAVDHARKKSTMKQRVERREAIRQSIRQLQKQKKP